MVTKTKDHELVEVFIQNTKSYWVAFCFATWADTRNIIIETANTNPKQGRIRLLHVSSFVQNVTTNDDLMVQSITILNSPLWWALFSVKLSHYCLSLAVRKRSITFMRLPISNHKLVIAGNISLVFNWNLLPVYDESWIMDMTILLLINIFY